MMKRGSSPEIMAYNVKELIRSGMAPRQAQAAAMAHKRRHMQESSEDGEVEDPGALDDGRRMKGYAEGGEVEGTAKGASSSRGASTGGVGSGLGGAGTGGAATGGASTGGAGTVNVTIGGGGSKKQKSKGEPNHINISGVGGTTDAGDVGSGDGPGAPGSGGGQDEDEEAQGYYSGGEVSKDMDFGLSTSNDEEAERSIGQMRDQGAFHPEVMNPKHQDHDRLLARALYKQKEKAEMMGYAMGGLVEGGDSGGIDQDDDPDDEPQGNDPTADMLSGQEYPNDGDERSELGHDVIDGVPVLDPSPLTKETLEAIRRNKKNRRWHNM